MMLFNDVQHFRWDFSFSSVAELAVAFSHQLLFLCFMCCTSTPDALAQNNGYAIDLGGSGRMRTLLLERRRKYAPHARPLDQHFPIVAGINWMEVSVNIDGPGWRVGSGFVLQHQLIR